MDLFARCIPDEYSEGGESRTFGSTQFLWFLLYFFQNKLLFVFKKQEKKSWQVEGILEGRLVCVLLY